MKKVLFFCVIFMCISFLTYSQSVKCKVYIQGAYDNGSLMNTGLMNLVSGNQPYNVNPWNYPGSESISSVPVNMVDWVLVELRDPNDSTIIIERRAALLLNDGTIADTNLATSVSFSNTTPGNYYLCVCHRNHLPVMSASPFMIPNNITYDFSDTLNFPPFGGGFRALIELEPDIFGMIAGDVNKDGILKYSGPSNDRGQVLQYIINQSGSANITTTVSGYAGEDINMDSIIKYSGPQNDPSMIIQNLVGLTGSVAITSVFNSVVPPGIPPFQCGMNFLDIRDTRSYRTAQIGSQCWLAENMNIGSMINSNVIPSHNQIIEKHCYNDDSSNCNIYGGLYTWDEMMQYSLQDTKGICPEGWHIPSDSEWKVLEGNTDSQYGVGDPVWDLSSWRGNDAGKNLKSTSGWFLGINGMDLYGFSVLPGGKLDNSSFSYLTYDSYFWTSTSTGVDAQSRRMKFSLDGISRDNIDKGISLSVRCIMDDCSPLPTQSDAGPDQYDICAPSTLAANIPINGSGTWSVVSGTGGSFLNDTIPNTTFTGVPGSTYELQWMISTNCGSSTDEVIISFTELPPNADAGPDHYNVCQTVSLVANDPGAFTGYWTILSGNGGILSDTSSYLTDFSGVAGESYVLLWTIVNHCGDISTDDVNVTFTFPPPQAYAGTDQVDICDTAYLDANDPGTLSGIWSVISGNGGVFSDPADNKSSFTGFPGGSYTLRWTISNGCSVSTYDDVNIVFDTLPISSNAGPDQNNVCDTAFLSANDQGSFSGIWSIISGVGGNLSDPNDNNAYFTGNAGESYTLRWIISNNCGDENTDDVVIIFESASVTANAGPDQSDICDSALMAANDPGSFTGTWSVVSGSGGSFKDVNDPGTTFYGISGETYVLKWSITLICGSSSDDVTIAFVDAPINANAGINLDNVCDTAFLNANDPGICSGMWTIHSGTGGIITDPGDYNTTFIGNAGDTYILRWTITNICGDQSYDYISVSFESSPPNANAGSNQSDVCDTAHLSANDPGSYTGLWSVYSGVGGSFDDPSDHITTFTGDAGESYILKWAIINACGEENHDYISVSFTPAPPIADAGPDQTAVCDTAWMNANDPGPFTGTWSVYSGVGGIFDNMHDYNTTFTGNAGEAYILKWTISNACGHENYDYITVSFVSEPPVADAGPDQSAVCDTAWMSANDPGSFTGTWSILYGSGGSFSDTNSYNAYFVGVPGVNYVLIWSIRNICGQTEQDFVSISILPSITQADAGPDTFNIIGDSVTLMANTPIIGQGLWTIAVGADGSFSDSTNPNSVFYGLPGYYYYLVWTITNECGSSSDTVIINFASTGSFVCGDPFIDSRDGESYATVMIGTQCWMKENLGYLPSVNPGGSGSQTAPYYYVYDYQGTSVTAAKATTNYQTYGVLYNYAAAMNGESSSNGVPSGVQGICPDGWHMPSDEEWKILEGGVDTQYGYPDPEWDKILWRGYDAGGHLKATGTTLWNSPNTGATNSSGFSALPGGVKYGSSGFTAMGTGAFFWTCTETLADNPNDRHLNYSDIQVNRLNYLPQFGCSVRCIKSSCSSQPTQANAGPDSLNILGDSIVMMANDPSPDQGLWTIHSGTGGSFSDSTNPNSVFYGLPGNLYYLVWTISNSCSSSSDTVIISFEGQSITCGDTLTDSRDGKRYGTVLIGNQCWISENLNVGTMINGTSDQSDNSVIEKYCFDNDPANCDTYGGLYQWDEAMQYSTTPGAQGICPAGWHVPTDDEWKILEGTVDSQYPVGDPEWDGTIWRGYDAGDNMKANYGWYNNNNGADAYGFAVLPGGDRLTNGTFNYWISDAYLLTSTVIDATDAWTRRFNFDYDGSGRYGFERLAGFSLRCLKTCELQPTQANAGSDSLNITGDSIVLSANDPSPDQGLWTIHSGTGGSFSDPTHPNAIFYGIPGITYELIWKISNTCSSSSDTVIISFEGQSITCGDTLTDSRDGKRYGTVLIGSQCWMSENLDIGTMTSGNNDQSDDGIIEKYCYNDNPANCITYGGLYQWDEAMQYYTTAGTQGICPTGWYLPSDDEWKTLEGFTDSQYPVGDPEWDGTQWRGYDAGDNLKANHGWYNNNNGADAYGFAVLPGGDRLTNGTFNYWISDGVFWTSTESTSTNAWRRVFNFNYDGIHRYASEKLVGLSVRCIKSCEIQPVQANAGSDSLNIVGDSIVLMANDPSPDQGLWTIQSGTGGSFSDPSNPNSVFYGSPGNLYYLVWTISNSCSSSSDTVIISFAGQGFTCGDTLTDYRDGKRYGTVLIGNQCWISENLNVGTMINGTSDQSDNSIIEKYCFNNDPANCDTYGGLYQWDEAMQYSTTPGVQGICPAGWHVPTDDEWKILEGTVDSQYPVGDPEWDGTIWRGYDAGDNMKANYGWYNNNNGADAYGLAVLPGGDRLTNGTFNYWISDAYLLTSTVIDTTDAWARRFNFDNDESGRYDFTRLAGFSLRCIRTCESFPIQANAGSDSLNITGDSIVLSANDPSPDQGLWTIHSGAGGSFSDSTNPNSVFYGLPGYYYYLVWTITNECGSSSDTVIINFASTGSFVCGDPFIDSRDGESYATVMIGTQCWMKENLGYLPSVNPGGSGSQTAPYYYVYDYQGTSVTAAKATTNYQTYGVLYNYAAAMNGESSSNGVPSGVQGICPDGWHMPSDEEWKILEGEVDTQYGYPDPEWDKILWRGYDAGGHLKATGTTLWNSPNTGANNSSGFSALPGGVKYGSSGFTAMGTGAFFWTCTETLADNPNDRHLNYSDIQVNRLNYLPQFGCSVRCIKSSCSSQPTQANAGPDSLNVIGNSIVLMANDPSPDQGLWTNISGLGGSFSDSANPNSVFYGLPGYYYYLVWKISNACASSYDTVIIHFASQGFICGDTLVDYRDGKHYGTVLIGSQCWMSENIDVGQMMSGNNDQNDDGVIEKYCCDDDPANCITFGGLYQWDEAMQYSTTAGAQGICPPDWHIPTDDEWKILEGNADSQYPVGDPEWDNTQMRGYDAGDHLKSDYGWYDNLNGSDLYGFTVLPAGDRLPAGGFNGSTSDGVLWTSTQSSSTHAWRRIFIFINDGIHRFPNEKQYGMSVRCLRTCQPTPTQANAGPDSLNIIEDSIVLMANDPTPDQGLWTIAFGAVGTFSDPSNHNSVFYGLPGYTYYLIWTITNPCGISSDTVVISFSSQSQFICGSTLIDSRDGESYATVQIGSQCWMKENLGYLPSVQPSNPASATVPSYYVYGYQGTNVAEAKATSNYQTYGALYNWPAVMNLENSSNSVPSGVQGICPSGWHLPSDEEWKILEGHVDTQYGYPDPVWDNIQWRGFDAGGNLKSPGTALWDPPNTGATNSSGFTALPGGVNYGASGFTALENGAFFWSCTETLADNPNNRHVTYDRKDINRLNYLPQFGCSVRCIKDPCSVAPTQANAGPDSLNIAADSIVLMANDPSPDQGLWTIQVGIGGSFSDSTNPNSVFYGLSGLSYNLVWTIINACGSSSDTVVISFASTGSFVCGDPFIDSRDGESYATVQIGFQCWMQENLAYLPSVSPSGSGSQTAPYYYVYDYQGTSVTEAKATTNYQTYGVLYNYAAAMNGENSSNSVPSGVMGVCPSGWHLPSDEEWIILEGEVDTQFGYPDPEWNATGWRGYDAGGHLKSTGTTLWNSPNNGATNNSGFTALPGGVKYSGGTFTALGSGAFYWSSTEIITSSPINRHLDSDETEVLRYNYILHYGCSVRCIKNP